MSEAASILRQFNRNFTQRIGVLDDRFLGLDRPLGASRLLWEIGDDGRSVAELRQILGLDSAYLSRLLRRLEAEQLIETVQDPDDARRRRAMLTNKGRREWQELEDRSARLAATMLESLTSSQRKRLGDALETADRLLRAATVVIGTVEPLEVDALEALSRYFAELDRRFDTGFDPGDITADANAFRSPNGRFLLATSSTTIVACGAVHRLERDTAEIKRMWVNDAWRGLGIGRRMLETLEQEGRSLGCSIVRLDTNSALSEAIAMYSSSGYRSIPRYNDNPFARRWFEKHLD